MVFLHSKAWSIFEIMKKAKWIFPAAVLMLILLLNLQDGDASLNLSERVGVFLETLFGNGWLRANVRRLGHMAEYFLLGFACCWCCGWKGLPLVAGVSVLDQCFKALIPVRHFDAGDLPYDMIGYLLGFCAVWAGRKIGRRLMERRNRRCIWKKNTAG